MTDVATYFYLLYSVYPMRKRPFSEISEWDYGTWGHAVFNVSLLVFWVRDYQISRVIPPWVNQQGLWLVERESDRLLIGWYLLLDEQWDSWMAAIISSYQCQQAHHRSPPGFCRESQEKPCGGDLTILSLCSRISSVQHLHLSTPGWGMWE